MSELLTDNTFQEGWQGTAKSPDRDKFHNSMVSEDYHRVEETRMFS